MSIISKEGIKEALETFKSAYKENKEKYEEENVKVEDVVNLTENFSEKKKCSSCSNCYHFCDDCYASKRVFDTHRGCKVNN